MSDYSPQRNPCTKTAYRVKLMHQHNQSHTLYATDNMASSIEPAMQKRFFKRPKQDIKYNTDTSTLYSKRFEVYADEACTLRVLPNDMYTTIEPGTVLYARMVPVTCTKCRGKEPHDLSWKCIGNNYCVYCKQNGHTKDTCEKLKEKQASKISCEYNSNSSSKRSQHMAGIPMYSRNPEDQTCTLCKRTGHYHRTCSNKHAGF